MQPHTREQPRLLLAATVRERAQVAAKSSGLFHMGGDAWRYPSNRVRRQLPALQLEDSRNIPISSESATLAEEDGRSDMIHVGAGCNDSG